MTEKMALRVGETAEAIGASRSKTYELIASGEIPHIKIGASIRVPVDALKDYIARKLAEAVAARG